MPKATRSQDPNPSDPGLVPLKWGILATGAIAKRFAADLHASGAGRAVACGSRTIEGARAFASAFGIPKAYGSYGELARDPEVEAVYVATPHTFHFEDALACLRNHKAVLCEKPLAVNSAQAAKLFETAEEHGVFLMEALWTYFLPALKQAQRWWTDGAIGELRLVQAEIGFEAPYDPAGRLFNPALAGGALLDVGVYALSLAQLVAASKTPRIKASAHKAATGVDETVSVLLDWNSGVRAHLLCSVAHPLSDEARIYGTKGTITLPSFWRAPSATLETAQGKTVFEDRRTTLGYDFEARAVTAAVRADRCEDSLVSKAFSLRLAATMDAVRKQIGVEYPGE
jgi:predicted dehydrogenase